MPTLKEILALVAGAGCFALAIIVLLALPGFLSDEDSVVPLAHPGGPVAAEPKVRFSRHRL